MRSNSLPPSSNYVVQIQCLIPPTLPPSSTLVVQSSSNNLIMTTSANDLPTNSFGISSSKSTTPQTTCNICKRLLYSFEEILVCRICDGSYHWRCVKPEMISHYGENAHFICDKCNDSIASTTTSSNHRLVNGGIKIKSANTSETDYRDFASIPSKLNATPTKDTTVFNAIRYFEEKQQQPSPHKISKLNESDGHFSSQTNGQFTDDNKTIRRIQQQQQKSIHTDDENISLEMFQANYQYTPLKEYAAMRNGRTMNDTSTNSYQNSPPTNSDRQLPSRYDNGLHYTNLGHELTKSTHFTSPTIDSLSAHNRQQHFISTTNLNVNDKSSRQQQNDYKNPSNNSTSYLSPIHDNESPTFKTTLPQQQTDRYSTIGSDSGIVMINPNQQHQTIDDNQVIEKKLTNLVHQIGRQLETDAQKLSDKLELKLKTLEHMIHQQTYIIRQQDEVIERLKTKISKIETERDHFRERLSLHEQREQDEKKYTATETEESKDRKTFEQDVQQQTFDDISGNRKSSTTSSVTTDNSKRSSKKLPAPRVDNRAPLINNENDSTVSKLIKTIPGNQEHRASDSSATSIAAKLAASVPIVEKPPAASRLDNIIHQSNTNNISDSTSAYYNLAEILHSDSKQTAEPISLEEQQIVPSIHHDDEQIKPISTSDIKLQRSASYSSSSSSNSESKHVNPYGLPSKKNVVVPARNSNLHRSLETISHKTSQTEQGLKPTNKTTSLEFGTKPVRYDESGSIYITPQEATHPASQYQNATKGWLRKQNRDSFFKRIERYYCVLSNNTLLMHKHENDRTPQKAINLKGGKVLYYEDQKHGPSLELTWSNRRNAPKHYHLYAPSPLETDQWAAGIQTAIHNLENKNKWQQYRMVT